MDGLREERKQHADNPYLLRLSLECLSRRENAPQLVGALDACKIKSFLGVDLQVIAQSICCYPDIKASAGSLARSRLRSGAA